jgi:hypothetical protein
MDAKISNARTMFLHYAGVPDNDDIDVHRQSGMRWQLSCRLLWARLKCGDLVDAHTVTHNIRVQPLAYRVRHGSASQRWAKERHQM